MRFLRSLANFLLALAFLCCHYIFDSVTCLTLSFDTIYVYFHSYVFGAYIVLNKPYFSRIQIDFKDNHREIKHSTVKLQCFRKVWLWTFGWLVHQINSIYEVPKLKQNFRKRKVVTGKTLFFVIGQFCSPHSICLNIGFWQSSFVRKCYVVNLSTFN